MPSITIIAIHLFMLLITLAPQAGLTADQPALSNNAQQGGETADAGRAAEGRPELFIPQQIYDAGEIWEGQEIVHTFIIVNRGTAMLEIFNVSPG